MRLRLTVALERPGGARHDLLVSCPEGTRFGRLRCRLAEVPGMESGIELSAWVGAIALSDDAAVGVPPLLDGAVIRVCPSLPVAAGSVRPVLRVRVTSGPDAGGVYPLGPGEHHVGRAAGAAIRVADPDISRVHARLDVRGDGTTVTDVGATNGARIDGLSLGAGADWRPGARLRLGSSVLELSVNGCPSAATTLDGRGHVMVNRQPRDLSHPPAGLVAFPAQPEPADRIRAPLLAVAMPLLLSIILAWVQQSAMYLLFGLMSPAMVLGNVVSDRFGGRRLDRRKLRDWIRAQRAADIELATALSEEAVWRRAHSPSCADLLEAAEIPGNTLWQRRPSDDDFLSLRLGLGQRESRLTVSSSDRSEATHPTVDDVPVVVDLRSTGVLGLSGERAAVDSLVRSLVAQVAGWQSPRDVELVLLAENATTLTAWSWMTLLPHTRSDHDSSYRSRVGSLDVQGQVRRRVVELELLVEHRGRHRRDDPSALAHSPVIVVVLAGAGRLRSVPGVARLLAEGPALGIVAICLDAARSQLPTECRTVVELDAGPQHDGCDTTVGESHGPARLLSDRVSAAWAEQFAQALAPLRDATPVDAALPDRVRLLDIVPQARLEPDALARSWRQDARSTECLLGLHADGPFSVDLRHDGPHILVGGMTGSGKSELLQTLIASLALANSPERLGFVLVDYKGGAAFGECAALPHALGLVTDLDAHLAQRALTSLTAELTRRERILRDAGAKDIDDYLAGPVTSPPQSPLARIVLVIDEFRMLAEELPAFLDGVVRIAALGRSLGVHLVLATQRPAGIVTADIAANVNLRIALRVRDQVDSEDVIEARDASHLSASTPGRAFARSGSNPLVMFQTARVGGAAEATDEISVDVLTPASLGEPIQHPAVTESVALTDLGRIVRCTTEAASLASVRAPTRPWLPPLPDVVTVDQLSAVPGGWHVPYAVADRPERQSQESITWDLANDTHLIVAGTLRSGRSSALRTIAGCVAARFDPGMVHIHAIDGGSGSLSSLRCLPHVGVVATSDDVQRGMRLIDLLAEEVAQRKRVWGVRGFGSLAEQHEYAGPAAALPYLTLLIDGWETVAAQWDSAEHGRSNDVLQGLLREGAAVGLRVAMTGDRGLLVSRLAAQVRDRVVLRLADPTDLALCGIPAAAVPRRQPAGRGIRVADLVEVQIALLTSDPSGRAQIDALHRIAREAAARAPTLGSRPLRIEPLPERIRLESLVAATRSLGPGRALVGVGGDAAEPVWLDLRASSAVVAGPARSGRSTTLVTLATSLAAGGATVVTVTSGLPSANGPAGLASSISAVSADDPRAVRAALEAAPGCFVFVDDVERLADTEAEDVLLQWFKVSLGSGGLVVAGIAADISASFRGLSVAARRSGQGVLLNPSYADGDLLRVRLPQPDPSAALPGRGVVVRNSSVMHVQVAEVSGCAPT